MLWKKLFDYQQGAARFILSKPGTCLFFDQGTGKTYVTLAVIDRESDQPQYQALLVVLKTNKLTTWLAKIEELLPHVHVSTDPDEFKKLPHPRILLVHYDQFTAKLSRKLAKWPWSFVAFDESQRLKNRGSLSSRNARRFRHARRRCVLSGTPVDKSPIDLWAQLRFAEMSIFGDHWPTFFNRYLRPAGFGGYKSKFRAGKEELFLKRASEVCLRVDRSVLNLPESKMHIIPVGLWGQQSRVYDELERDLVIEIGETGTVSTPLKVTLMGKLSQITGGFLIDDEGEVHRVGKAKERALKALLPKMKPPVVVFCRYRHEVHMLENLLRGYYLAVKSIYGKIKDTAKSQERSNILRAFQAGEIDALVCQVRTGGVGVDLWKSDYAIVHSMGHSSIDFNQMASRLDNINKRVAARIYVLCGKSTIDEDLYDMIVDKGMTSKEVLDQLKQGAR